MDKNYDFYKQWYPTELREIAEIIASGKPKISKDDICDQLLEIWETEKKTKRPGDERPNAKNRKYVARYEELSEGC